MSAWSSGVWNIVLVGNNGTPAAHCGSDGGNPYTVVEETPLIVEKPYVVMDGDKFSLMVPRVETNKKGPTPGYSNADEIPFENVYVASDSDSAATINEKF
jgi:hypothetical protein